MDWIPVFDFLLTLSPIVGYVLMGLGALVTFGIFIDSIIDDKKDKGFMKKILAKPIIGDILNAIKRFSPFNIKE